MAHFAKLGMNGKVIGVHVVNNKDILNGSGVEDEKVGQQFLEGLHGWPASMWIQTSYNTQGGTHKLGGTPLRANYAGIGQFYDEDNNIFRPKSPYASWVLNTTTGTWHSPIGDAPDDLTAEEIAAHTHYVWNEDNKSWDKTTPEA
tara:strand:- start:125 stop:559 length:435 start_codon:yes stop_codon:yes gene_type:complete